MCLRFLSFLQQQSFDCMWWKYSRAALILWIFQGTSDRRFSSLSGGTKKILGGGTSFTPILSLFIRTNTMVSIPVMAFTLEYDAIQESKLSHLKTHFQGKTCNLSTSNYSKKGKNWRENCSIMQNFQWKKMQRRFISLLSGPV